MPLPQTTIAPRIVHILVSLDENMIVRATWRAASPRAYTMTRVLQGPDTKGASALLSHIPPPFPSPQLSLDPEPGIGTLPNRHVSTDFEFNVLIPSLFFFFSCCFRSVRVGLRHARSSSAPRHVDTLDITIGRSGISNNTCGQVDCHYDCDMDTSDHFCCYVLFKRGGQVCCASEVWRR